MESDRPDAATARAVEGYWHNRLWDLRAEYFALIADLARCGRATAQTESEYVTRRLAAFGFTIEV